MINTIKYFINKYIKIEKVVIAYIMRSNFCKNIIEKNVNCLSGKLKRYYENHIHLKLQLHKQYNLIKKYNLCGEK